MNDCCDTALTVAAEQRRVLQIVLWINGLMFLAEFVAALAAHSTSLLADSADMLGDAIVYGASLYIVVRGGRGQAEVSLLKGGIMAAFAAGVLIEALMKLLHGVVPTPEVMTGIGLLALAANAAVLALLWRRRADDINMRSVWLCSRNDVVANVGVLLAAGAVAWLGSAWPDVVVGSMIAAMFGSSALDVIRDARRELRSVPTP